MVGAGGSLLLVLGSTSHPGRLFPASPVPPNPARVPVQAQQGSAGLALAKSGPRSEAAPGEVVRTADRWAALTEGPPGALLGLRWVCCPQSSDGDTRGLGRGHGEECRGDSKGEGQTPELSKGQGNKQCCRH